MVQVFILDGVTVGSGLPETVLIYNCYPIQCNH